MSIAIHKRHRTIRAVTLNRQLPASEMVPLRYQVSTHLGPETCSSTTNSTNPDPDLSTILLTECDYLDTILTLDFNENT